MGCCPIDNKKTGKGGSDALPHYTGSGGGARFNMPDPVVPEVLVIGGSGGSEHAQIAPSWRDIDDLLREDGWQFHLSRDNLGRKCFYSNVKYLPAGGRGKEMIDAISEAQNKILERG